MKVKIYPSEPRGVFVAPPSKSMAHRHLICAGFAKGVSRISNLAFSEDVLATVDCLRELGAEVFTGTDYAEVKGIGVSDIRDGALLDCRECGTTFRFFIPLAMLSPGKITLTGSDRLLERPIDVYEEIFRKKNLHIEKGGRSVETAGPLAPGVFDIDFRVSSQFVSGLCLALACLDGDSEIRLSGRVESAPYIEMTLAVMRLAGADCEKNGDTILIKGRGGYKPFDATVEGDWSNAAFFEYLSYMGNLEIRGLDLNSLQGDRAVTEYLKRLYSGFSEIDIADTPDLGPVLFAAAASMRGAKITGTRRLRYKESDRAACMKAELEKFGAEIEIGEDSVTVFPSALHTPETELDCHNDHRIAMALACLAVRYGGTLTGAECVAKSMPDFFDRLIKTGIRAEIYEA